MSHQANLEEGLSLQEYKRYGRQMIIQGFGLPGQISLKHSSVAVVGAGGLGCPALQYLAAAGVGRIGVIDGDIVEMSNLQRQVMHSEAAIGISKVASVVSFIAKLNSAVVVDAYEETIHSQNAERILSLYDIILDCTDNAPTRYLLSDVAVRLGKPLVSGAAQKFDGQLCTYNLLLPNDAGRGPCYRCLFPKPPAQEVTGSCEETGIIGAVTGVIGTLQAMETIKILTGLHDGNPSLLVYSALSVPPFRSVKLRARRKDCPSCGVAGSKIGEISDTDYVTFCGGPRPNWEQRGLEAGQGSSRVDAKSLAGLLEEPNQAVELLDVRSSTEYGICHLPRSNNIPLPELLADPAIHLPRQPLSKVVVICRLGNDSQLAAQALRSVSLDDDSRSIEIHDLIGGLRSWSKDIDKNFPVY